MVQGILVYTLTPKGPNYIFWQHRNLGKYMWLEICMLYAEILIECMDEEYISFAVKLRTFENMSQKLWSNMLFLFSVNGPLDR